MLAIITLSCLVLAHQCSGSDLLDKLHKTHQTSSLKLTSVESMIEEALAADPSLSEAEIRAKLEAHLGPETKQIVRKVDDPKWSKNPPAYFDAREKWPACADVINDIEDEGACLTGGPPIAASMASDRYCIHTNGTFRQKLSAQYLATCAEACTKEPQFWMSFLHLRFYGVPTGGNYKSKKGCIPYELEPCKHSNTSDTRDSRHETWHSGNGVGKVKNCDDMVIYDRKCHSECSNHKYPTPLNDDRKQFTTFYTFFRVNEFQLRSEIMTYGPLATNIALYDDFYEYPEKGMYVYRGETKRGRPQKTIKLIGWGEEDGIKYWLAMNTWDNWGNTKVFKIPRGTNHVDVEMLVSAGVFEDLH